jgi:uncharacterized protein YdiU (UPF0061 family)
MEEKIKTEWERFEELLKEIYSPSNKKTDRDVTVLLGLYGEYITNWFLENNTTKLKGLSSKELDQDIKLKVLYELKIISESEYDVLDKIRKIRNEYAHKLELTQGDYDRIKSWMENITINWDEKNEDPNSLEKMMRKNPFLKFQLACLTKIGYLLTKIGREKGQQIQKTIIFDVEIEGQTHKLKIL